MGVGVVISLFLFIIYTTNGQDIRRGSGCEGFGGAKLIIKCLVSMVSIYEREFGRCE